MSVSMGSFSSLLHDNRNSKMGPNAFSTVTDTLAIGDVNNRVVCRLFDGVVDDIQTPRLSLSRRSAFV